MNITADQSGLVCRRCGAPLQGGGHCPACLLELALAEEARPTEDEARPTQPGRFDHYQLCTRQEGVLEACGRGGMGVTYRAVATVLGHAVALKVLEAQVATRPEARARFLREARAAARLRHPNVASVSYYGVRESDGQCFYAMDLVEGETLEARVRRAGPLPAPEALEIVAQVARALAVAEAQGVVHRDLKPTNLMLAKGPELTVKVIDFGLAKAADAASEADLSQGGFVGTPAYASPEQFTGAGVDARSDLYALGVTLWQLLTGEPPFRGSRTEVMHQHLRAPLPLERLKEVPSPAVALLEKLLQKDPAHRFQGAAELLQAISTALGATTAGETIDRLDDKLHKPAERGPRAPARLRAAARWWFSVFRALARPSANPFRGALAWGSLLLILIGTALIVLFRGSFPSPTPFALEVRVHGEGGSQELTPRNRGRVRLELGSEHQSEPIRENGAAYFPSIPAAFRHQPVSIRLESEDFELSSPDEQRRLEGSRLDLAVRKKPGRIAGRVHDEQGSPVVGATIRVGGLSTQSDAAGHFELEIPGGRLQPELDLEAVAQGYGARRLKVVPNANEVVIPLVRRP